ncbi:hypothetical protein ES703_92841 [subsurface metagenome]
MGFLKAAAGRAVELGLELRRFGVSITAATIRAEELELVPKNRCRFCEERKDGRRCPL